MSWSQVNTSNWVPAKEPKARYIPSRYVGPKDQGFQKKERAHWATPNGSWAAPPAAARRGGSGSLLPIQFPGRPPLGPGGGRQIPRPVQERGPGGGRFVPLPQNHPDPRMSIQNLLLRPAGQQSQIQRLLAVFAALGHLPTMPGQQRADTSYGMD